MRLEAILIVLVLGGGMIGAGAMLVKSQIDQRVEAEVAATAERTRAELAEREVERITAALEAEQARQEQLVEQLEEARQVEAESVAVLEDRDRLDRLTQAKPGLLERLARSATTEVWAEIETESAR